MSTKFSFKLVCVLAVIVMLLSACGGGTQSLADKIIGKWSATQGGVTVNFEFSKDGKVVMEMSGITANFTYKWTDATNMVIDMTSQGGAAQALAVSTSGSNLILDDGKGTTDSKVTLTPAK